MDGCLVNLITKSSFCNHLSHWDLKAERELLTETSFFPVVVPAVISTPKPHRETLPHDSKTKLHLGADGRVVGVSSNRTRNSGLLGMGWTIASFLVVPILVAERKSPIDALKGSASLLKKTWGEQLVGNFSFGFVFFLLAIPAYLAIALAVYVRRPRVEVDAAGGRQCHRRGALPDPARADPVCTAVDLPGGLVPARREQAR